MVQVNKNRGISNETVGYAIVGTGYLVQSLEGL